MYARFLTKIFALFTLSLCAAAAAQLSFDVQEGKNKWGYGARIGSVIQPWNGSAVAIETTLRLPAESRRGSLPPESFAGILIQDTQQKTRYIAGLFNRRSDRDAPVTSAGVIRYESGGHWDPLQFSDHSVHVDRPVGLRLRFTPGKGENQRGTVRLQIRSQEDGNSLWTDAWRYRVPAGFSPDRVGLAADGYKHGWGPVRFDKFTVTGQGPARSDRFDGSGDIDKWEQHGTPRVGIDVPCRMDLTLLVDDNEFIFDRATPSVLRVRARTTKFVDQSLSLHVTLADGRGRVVLDRRETVPLSQPSQNLQLDLPASALKRNGVYTVEITVSDGSRRLASVSGQLAVIEPRPIPQSFDPESPYGYCWGEDHLKSLARIGIRWARSSWFRWNLPRGEDGQYDFDKTVGPWIEKAAEYGILEIGPICAPAPMADHTPEEVERYINDHVAMIRQARERYGDKIRLIEIGNEPENWPRAPLPHEWLTMARAQAEITRRVHEQYPDVRVMSTGTTHINLAYIAQLAAVGGPDAADVIAVHGYRNPSPPEFGHREDVRAINSLFPDTPVWCSEQAYFADPPDTHPTYDNPGLRPVTLSEEKQAIYLPRLLLCQLAAGYDGVTWYAWASDHGLTHSPTHVRPGLCSLAALTDMLPHPEFQRRLTPANSELWALQFESDGRRVTAVWSLGPQWVVRFPAGQVEHAYDMFGNSIDGAPADDAIEFPVGQAPIYLQGPLESVESRRPRTLNDPRPYPAWPEAQADQALTMAIKPRFDDEGTAGLNVRLTNRTKAVIRGTLSLKFNDGMQKYYRAPLPEGWRIEAVEEDHFELAPAETTTVGFRVVSDDPATPFDPYEKKAGCVNMWWASGYFFALRASLADGRTVDLVRRTGMALHGAPRQPEFEIDGQLNEWSDIPAFPHLGSRARNIALNKFWTGFADYLTTFQLAWSPDGLLFAAEVTDDIHHQPYSGRDTWRCDSLDLAVDPGPDEASAVDYHLFTMALTEEGAEIFRRRPTSSLPAGPVAGVSVAVSRQEGDTEQLGRTTYEALIPWEAVGMERPTAHQRLGFAVQFNESDGWERMGWEGWFISMGGQIVDSERFGDLTLLPAGMTP